MSSHRRFCGWVALMVLVAVVASVPASAQVQNRTSLAEMAQQKSVEWQEQRAAAEERAAVMGLPIRQELADGTVIELQRFDGDRPIYYITDNLNAAISVSTDNVWPGSTDGFSLTGTGQTLGIWDSGSLRTTHQEFTGRATNLDAAGTSFHSTHVAGTMIAAGTNPSARGMSSAASIRSHDFNSDSAEMAAEQLLPQPIRVSNHSYGFISGWRFNFFNDGLWVWFGDVQLGTTEDSIFGFYHDSAREFDQIAFDSPEYLIVKSAGNDRGEGPAPGGQHHHLDGEDFVIANDSHPVDGGGIGWDTIGGGPGSAKNILTIGAVSDVAGGYAGPGSVNMSSFSGWGPTDDGRIKPDLVANGVGLTSSSSSGDTAYASISGTSMSTPNASGSIGLLGELAQTLFGSALRAATLKAVAIHTADETGTADGPDYSFGWGLLNTQKAARVLSDQAKTTGGDFYVQEACLDDGTTLPFTLQSDGRRPLRVTIAWTDPPGTPPAAAVDPPDLMLVNDLDLRVTVPTAGGPFEPWVLDPANPGNAATRGDNFRDTVEQVHIDSPAAGTYTATVSHKGNLATEGAEQCFSLVASGNTTRIFDDGFETGGLGNWSAQVSAP